MPESQLHSPMERRNGTADRASEDESRLRLLIEHLPAGVVLFQGDDVAFNKAAAEIIGYAPAEITTVDQWFARLYGPKAHDIRQRLEALAKEDFPRPTRAFITSKEGVSRLIEFTHYLDPAGIVGFMFDITDRQRAEDALEASEQYARGIVEASIDMIIAVDNDRRIVEFNPAAEASFGYSREEVIGQSVDLLYEKPENGDQVHGTIVERGYWRGEVINRRKNGESFPSLLSASTMYNNSSIKKGVVGISRDISIQKQAEQRIRLLAYSDELTRLPNRTSFLQTLEYALAQAARRNSLCAVMLIDLDGFKNINDALGHAAGDSALQQIADHLKGGLRESDMVARFGGDEFVVLVNDVADCRSALDVARKILAAVCAPVTLEGRRYSVTGSIGISLYPNDGEGAEALLMNADIAMYRAKHQGKNSAQLYSAALNQSVEKLVVGSSIARALQDKEFIVHYQPQVVRGQYQVEGMEALVRWQHPEFGMMLPSRFIALAEESGSISELGVWVLKTSCEHTSELHRSGFPELRVSVNLSARQFGRTDLVDSFRAVLQDAGLHPQFVEVELTESTMMYDPDHAVRMLGEFKDMGMRISVDDFGTGYSSLSLLKRLPLDCIKIDRSFIQDIPHDTGNLAITRAVIAMAKNLNLKIVAEGVENSDQVELLEELGCDTFQGNYFSEPLERSELGRFLQGKAAPESGGADFRNPS